MGLCGLDAVFRRVRTLGLSGDALREELFRRIKAYNYVPEDREEDYKTAILGEYEAFLGEVERWDIQALSR